MPRRARIVIPGTPHYFLQRGKPGETVFCTDREREMFLRLLAHNSQRFGLRVLAYCLLPDRYGLVAVPMTADAAGRALSRVHSDYARVVNLDRDARGALWKSRYVSVPLAEGECWRVVAEVERSPIDAGLVRLAEFHRWSSASARLGLRAAPAWLDLESWGEKWSTAAWRRVLRGGDIALARAVASTCCYSV
jgi:putative transposase